MSNKPLKISLIVSLCLHIIMALLVAFLIDKYKDIALESTPTKVKMGFKRGGDSAMKDSTFRENTPMPSISGALSAPTPPPAPQSTPTPPQEQPSPTPTPRTPTPSRNFENLQLYTPSAPLYAQSQSNQSQQSPKLSQALRNAPSQVREDIMSLYGDELGDYGVAEQDFIINNLRDIGRITQYHLSLRGYPPDAGYLGQEGENAVEFFLYANGDISDLKIIDDKSSGSMILDKNTIRTIQIAFKDYPRPTTKVKIKIFVRYYLITR